jgi:transcriptional regulator with XRE-family HTH domain
MLRLFGNNLARLRKAKNLTVGQVAQRLDCHPSALCHMEKGRRLPPSSEKFDQLVGALEASADEVEALRRAAIWTILVNRLEDLGYSAPEVVLRECVAASSGAYECTYHQARA